MLVEDTEFCRRLEQLIACLAADPTLREDLLQEGLLRLWEIERQHPGRTESWYLQNCRFRVLHWLASGRSIDSPKRSRRGNWVSLDDTERQGEPIQIPDPCDVVGTVSFNDLQTVLSRQLTLREMAVLQGLTDGLRLREIASQAGLSYPTAIKYRRRIAALVSRLELPTFFGRAKPSLDPVPGVKKPAAVRVRTKRRPAKPNETTIPSSWPGGGREMRRISKGSLPAATRLE
jgi:DNA-directed RNA polymerase specialized sigma24 family protein